MWQEIFGESEDLTNVDAVVDVDVCVVHVHLVHVVLETHSSTQCIEGASETSKQEKAMSQKYLKKRKSNKKKKGFSYGLV